MDRQRPECIPEYAWDCFIVWADKNGVGTHPDDWRDWLQCWMDGYEAATLERT